jgi:hypothetical protein
MATLKNTTIDDTGFLTIPVGTIAQRPGSPVAGMIRLVTNNPDYTAPVVEYYDGSEWKSLYTPVTTGVGGTVTSAGGYSIHSFTSGTDVFSVTQD